MAEVSNQFSIDEDEPMQTEPINLSSDEYTDSHSSMSDQFLTVETSNMRQSANLWSIQTNRQAES